MTTNPERPPLEKWLVDPDFSDDILCPRGENDCCNGCVDAGKAARYAIRLEIAAKMDHETIEAQAKEIEKLKTAERHRLAKEGLGERVGEDNV